jgi:hypothetical protein
MFSFCEIFLKKFNDHFWDTVLIILLEVGRSKWTAKYIYKKIAHRKALVA